MMTRTFIILLVLLPFFSFSQDDLLDQLDNETAVDDRVIATFKGLKVVNFESTKLASKKDFYFIVAHRFGSVQNGFKDLFGLDNSVTQLKFLYGVNDWLNVGVTRSSLQAKYGFHAKYKLVSQKTNGSPFSIVGYNLMTINTGLDKDIFPLIEFEDRLNYVSQLLIAHKVNENLSVLIAPTYLHENTATRSTIVNDDNTVSIFDEENDQFMVGLGGRMKLTTRWSINMDYGVHLNRNNNSLFSNPLSIGVDLETGGHVFQMHFTNAQSMFEDGFISKAEGDWSDGNFFFGFNLSRVF